MRSIGKHVSLLLSASCKSLSLLCKLHEQFHIFDLHFAISLISKAFPRGARIASFRTVSELEDP